MSLLGTFHSSILFPLGGRSPIQISREELSTLANQVGMMSLVGLEDAVPSYLPTHGIDREDVPKAIDQIQEILTANELHAAFRTLLGKPLAPSNLSLLFAQLHSLAPPTNPSDQTDPYRSGSPTSNAFLDRTLRLCLQLMVLESRDPRPNIHDDTTQDLSKKLLTLAKELRIEIRVSIEDPRILSDKECVKIFEMLKRIQKRNTEIILLRTSLWEDPRWTDSGYPISKPGIGVECLPVFDALLNSDVLWREHDAVSDSLFHSILRVLQSLSENFPSHVLPLCLKAVIVCAERMRKYDRLISNLHYCFPSDRRRAVLESLIQNSPYFSKRARLARKLLGR